MKCPKSKISLMRNKIEHKMLRTKAGDLQRPEMRGEWQYIGLVKEGSRNITKYGTLATNRGAESGFINVITSKAPERILLAHPKLNKCLLRLEAKTWPVRGETWLALCLCQADPHSILSYFVYLPKHSHSCF